MGVAISYCYYFEPHVRVDLVQCVPGCLHLAQLGLLQLEETVHVSHLHLVIVKQQQLGEGGEKGRGTTRATVSYTTQKMLNFTCDVS